jgi:cystathionine beta-lyase family protein involved in aluminum resistance
LERWIATTLVRSLIAFRTLGISILPNVIIFVDNCYGEFVEEQEPTEVGADIIAGSLIKNHQQVLKVVDHNLWNVG